MEVDTDVLRAVGGELGMIALAWLGSPMSGHSIQPQPGAFGDTPLGAELTLGLLTFVRRAQQALRDLTRLVDAAGQAFLLSAAQFERAEESVAMSAR